MKNLFKASNSLVWPIVIFSLWRLVNSTSLLLDVSGTPGSDSADSPVVSSSDNLDESAQKIDNSPISSNLLETFGNPKDLFRSTKNFGFQSQLSDNADVSISNILPESETAPSSGDTINSDLSSSANIPLNPDATSNLDTLPHLAVAPAPKILTYPSGFPITTETPSSSGNSEISVNSPRLEDPEKQASSASDDNMPTDNGQDSKLSQLDFVIPKEILEQFDIPKGTTSDSNTPKGTLPGLIPDQTTPHNWLILDRYAVLDPDEASKEPDCTRLKGNNKRLPFCCTRGPPRKRGRNQPLDPLTTTRRKDCVPCMLKCFAVNLTSCSLENSARFRIC